MKIACIGYRDWSLEIYSRIEKSCPNHSFILYKSKEEFDEDALINFNPDFILFYGWSWMVPEKLTNNFTCVMLHPSPLPKYRGGSPLQNQIIAGEEQGAVTLFIIDKEIDAGPILAQENISLLGQLTEVFERIIEVGAKLTLDLLKGKFSPIEQDHTQATYCKRRKPEESELTIDEISNRSATYLHNKIRMLQDPYPNAFIRTADGEKLFITSSKVAGKN